MIRALLPLLLLSTAAYAEPVKLGHQVEPVGTTCMEDKIFAATATANGRSAEQKKHVTKTIEVLATANGAVSKAKVTYTGYTGGDAVIAKTYVLAFDGGTLTIARADNKPVEATERALVEKDNQRFGKPDVFAEALVGIPFERGKRTTVPSDKLAQWEDFPQPVKAALTLSDMRGADSVFKLELEAGTDASGQKLAITGTAVVERTSGLVRSLDGGGTFIAKGATGTVHMTASMSCKRP